MHNPNDRQSKANPSEPNPYSPGSAEYKALERLRNPCGEDEWVVWVDDGDEVDVDAAIARLQSRGYEIDPVHAFKETFSEWEETYNQLSDF